MYTRIVSKNVLLWVGNQNTLREDDMDQCTEPFNLCKHNIDTWPSKCKRQTSESTTLFYITLQFLGANYEVGCRRWSCGVAAEQHLTACLQWGTSWGQGTKSISSKAVLLPDHIEYTLLLCSSSRVYIYYFRFTLQVTLTGHFSKCMSSVASQMQYKSITSGCCRCPYS